MSARSLRSAVRRHPERGDYDRATVNATMDEAVFCHVGFAVDGHHSTNYRSAVVFGRARAVEEREEKLAALKAVSERVVRGRWVDARRPNEKDLAGTRVLAVEIEEASAKVRSGPPGDFDADVDLPIWAGVIPLRLVAGEPETDERVPEGVGVPEYARTYARP